MESARSLFRERHHQHIILVRRALTPLPIGVPLSPLRFLSLRSRYLAFDGECDTVGARHTQARGIASNLSRVFQQRTMMIAMKRSYSKPYFSRMARLFARNN